MTQNPSSRVKFEYVGFEAKFGSCKNSLESGLSSWPNYNNTSLCEIRNIIESFEKSMKAEVWMITEKF